MEFIAVKFEWNRFIFLKIKLTIKLIQLAPKTLDRIFFKKIKNKKKIVDFISVHSDTARLLINDTHAGKVSPPPPRSSLKASGPLSDTFDPKIGQQWQRCKLGNFFFFFFFDKQIVSGHEGQRINIWYRFVYLLNGLCQWSLIGGRVWASGRTESGRSQ